MIDFKLYQNRLQDHLTHPTILGVMNDIFVEVAVAGLSKEDLDIELADGILSHHVGPNTQVVNGSNDLVYQIAQRAFQQLRYLMM